MENPTGELSGEVLLRPPINAPVSRIGGHLRRGLLAYRELDDALGLTTTAGEMLADARTGGRHALVGLLRQSVFGRLAEYEATPNACGTAIRWIVGEKAVSGASASQMGRFETKWLAVGKNLIFPAAGSIMYMVAVRPHRRARRAPSSSARDPKAFRASRSRLREMTHPTLLGAGDNGDWPAIRRLMERVNDGSHIVTIDLECPPADPAKALPLLPVPEV
jgi:hypothetical protein